jgi:hypothetical protein
MSSMPTDTELKTPDFTPEAIVALILGIVSNLIVLFELDLSDARKGAISGLITTGVLVAFLFHSAIIRKGRATGSTLRTKGE